MTRDAARRVGAAISTGEYPLPVGELAVLLAAAAHRPVGPGDPSPAAADVLVRLWADLAAVDRDTAAKALVAAQLDGAADSTVRRLHTVINPNPPTRQE